MASICSEHQIGDPDCPRCQVHFNPEGTTTMRIPTPRDAEYTEIANRFAAFFGGRPVGEQIVAGMKPEMQAEARERDEKILLYVSQLCGCTSPQAERQ